MKNLTKLFGIIAMVAVIGFAMSGCAGSPPPQDQIQELKLDNGTYGPLSGDIVTRIIGKSHFWFRIQPIVSGDLQVEISGPGGDLVLAVYGNNNRRIARKIAAYPSIVFPVEAGNSYLFKVSELDATRLGRFNITAFDVAQRAEEKNRAEAAKAEERRQAELARQEQQAQQEQARQAEQTRLANLYRQAGNNLGNLRNTSRSFRQAFNRGTYQTTRYDFGDGDYIRQVTTEGMPGGPRTGTFRVSGDTVIFLSSEGVYSSGTIIGTTLTIGGNVYR